MSDIKGKYIVKVIEGKCIGAATCVGVAMNTFKLNDNNIAEVISEDQDTAEDILLAAQACPTNAIVLIDKETGKQVWPEGE